MSNSQYNKFKSEVKNITQVTLKNLLNVVGDSNMRLTCHINFN